MEIDMSACQHKGRSGGREILVNNKKKQFLTNIKKSDTLISIDS